MIALTISYSGTSFAGYQFQPGKKTVQGDLEAALSRCLRKPIQLDVCGRTDRGVHATGQVVSITDSATIIENTGQLIRSVAALTDYQIIVQKVHSLPDTFHPRFKCRARLYEYLIGEYPPSPLHKERVWVPAFSGLPARYHTETLQEMTSALIGHRDFQTFTRAEYEKDTTIRYIDLIEWDRIVDPMTGSSLIRFRIRGNAFLHNMIRIIVGTAIDAYRKKINLSFSDLLAARNRTLAGSTAPPHALYLRQCLYAAEEWSPESGLALMEGYPDFRPPRPDIQ